jgi:hypothetical protein
LAFWPCAGRVVAVGGIGQNIVRLWAPPLPAIATG